MCVCVCVCVCVCMCDESGTYVMDNTHIYIYEYVCKLILAYSFTRTHLITYSFTHSLRTIPYKFCLSFLYMLSLSVGKCIYKLTLNLLTYVSRVLLRVSRRRLHLSLVSKPFASCLSVETMWLMGYIHTYISQPFHPLTPTLTLSCHSLIGQRDGVLYRWTHTKQM